MSGLIRRGQLRFALVAAVLIFSGFSAPFFYAGCVVFFTGVLFHLWTSLVLLRNERLCTQGPYSFVRHPLYFANMMIDAGIILLGGLPYFLAYTLFFYVAYRRTIKSEESYLISVYGEKYVEYMGLVPALLPTKFPAFSEIRVEVDQSLLWHNKEVPRFLRFISLPLVLIAKYSYGIDDRVMWICIGVSAACYLASVLVKYRNKKPEFNMRKLAFRLGFVATCFAAYFFFIKSSDDSTRRIINTPIPHIVTKRTDSATQNVQKQEVKESAHAIAENVVRHEETAKVEPKQEEKKPEERVETVNQPKEKKEPETAQTMVQQEMPPPHKQEGVLTSVGPEDHKNIMHDDDFDFFNSLKAGRKTKSTLDEILPSIASSMVFGRFTGLALSGGKSESRTEFVDSAEGAYGDFVSPTFEANFKIDRSSWISTSMSFGKTKMDFLPQNGFSFNGISFDAGRDSTVEVNYLAGKVLYEFETMHNSTTGFVYLTTGVGIGWMKYSFSVEQDKSSDASISSPFALTIYQSASFPIAQLAFIKAYATVGLDPFKQKPFVSDTSSGWSYEVGGGFQFMTGDRSKLELLFVQMGSSFERHGREGQGTSLRDEMRAFLIAFELSI